VLRPYKIHHDMNATVPNQSSCSPQNQTALHSQDRTALHSQNTELHCLLVHHRTTLPYVSQVEVPSGCILERCPYRIHHDKTMTKLFTTEPHCLTSSRWTFPRAASSRCALTKSIMTAHYTPPRQTRLTPRVHPWAWEMAMPLCLP